MKKLPSFFLLAAASTALLAGCQAGTGGNPSSSELDGLCDQYVWEVRAGSIEGMQTLTRRINAKNANKSAGDQIKWLRECLERHNL